MAIKIPFVADVAGFLRGTGDVVDSLEDVEDALDDLGRSRGPDAAEQDLEGLGKTADASAEKLERSFSDAFDTLQAEGRTATRRVKGDVDDFGHSGSGTLREFRDEAKQNLAESVSSFRGDADSAVDAVQSTFGGLAAALGPAGIIGAAVAAAGIGLARGMFEKAKQEAQEFQERVADLASVMNELGTTRLDAGSINATIKEWSETAEDGSNKLVELRDAAVRAGLDPVKYIRAMAGDQKALAQITAEVTQAQKDYAESTVDAGAAARTSNSYLAGYRQTASSMTTTWGASATAVDAHTAALHAEQDALKASQTELGDVDKSLRDAGTASDLFRTATQDSAAASEDAAEALQAENDELTENARLKGDAAAASWDMAEALEAVNVKVKGGKSSLDAHTKAGRENAREVLNALEAINNYGDAQIDAGASTTSVNAKLKAQEDALVRRIMPAFAGSEAKARAYIQRLGGIPKRKDTDVKVTDNGTVKQTQEQINNIKSSGVPVPVAPDMTGFDASVKKYLNGKAYYVTVAPRAGKNAFT